MEKNTLFFISNKDSNLNVIVILFLRCLDTLTFINSFGILYMEDWKIESLVHRIK